MYLLPIYADKYATNRTDKKEVSSVQFYKFFAADMTKCPGDAHNDTINALI